MNSFENYVYMSICENLLVSFEKTNFQSFTSYCSILSDSLQSRNLSGEETMNLIILIDNIQLIYGFDEPTIGMYIMNFLSFDNERILEFHKAVKAVRHFYPFSFN